MKSIFITGCDTGIGKTFVSLGLAISQYSKGLKVGYFKPLQSGAIQKNDKLSVPDVDEFNNFPYIKTKYSHLFKGEISPHLACLLNNIEVDINKIKEDFIDFSKDFDLTITEGAGGLYCPAFKGNLFSDVIKYLNQEIIIVSTPHLGRLNHLLMTIECAKLNNIKIKGIIINKMPKNPTLSEENFINEFQKFSNAKILGVIPQLEKFSEEKIIECFRGIEL